MINESDKQVAWMALCESIALGQVHWPAYLSQEQIDYITTSIDRNAFPGNEGKTQRALARWNSLDFAFEILKSRQPEKSDRQIYDKVARHYDLSWTTVRKARSKMREREFSFARRHKELGFEAEDFAKLSLPHINFDSFSEE